jgi:hypothetical protein
VIAMSINQGACGPSIDDFKFRSMTMHDGEKFSLPLGHHVFRNHSFRPNNPNYPDQITTGMTVFHRIVFDHFGGKFRTNNKELPACVTGFSRGRGQAGKYCPSYDLVLTSLGAPARARGLCTAGRNLPTDSGTTTHNRLSTHTKSHKKHYARRRRMGTIHRSPVAQEVFHG